jgi:hypothetical protein
MDDAALERYAEAAWKLRCERSAEAKERPPVTVPWSERAPFLRDIDMAAASLVAAMAVRDAGFDQAELAAEIIRLRVRLDAIVHEVCGRVARECERRGNALPPGVERTAWLSAAAVALAARETQERDDGKEPS